MRNARGCERKSRLSCAAENDVQADLSCGFAALSECPARSLASEVRRPDVREARVRGGRERPASSTSRMKVAAMNQRAGDFRATPTFDLDPSSEVLSAPAGVGVRGDVSSLAGRRSRRGLARDAAYRRTLAAVDFVAAAAASTIARVVVGDGELTVAL